MLQTILLWQLCPVLSLIGLVLAAAAAAAVDMRL